MHLGEIGSDDVDWIQLAHGDAEGSFVKMEMNFVAV
jgi:hypothetical protein